MRQRRSLTAQIQELSQTIDERRRAASAAPNPTHAAYRLQTLADTLDVLIWLQRNEPAVRAALTRKPPAEESESS